MNRRHLGAAARSQVMARNAASDGALGAAFGLLVASGVVACNLDLQDGLAQGGAPLSQLFGLVSVAVTQGAVAASLGGMLWRQFAGRD